MPSLEEINLSDALPMRTWETIKEGEYQAFIVSSLLKPTKAGGSNYFEFTFQIIAGEYMGRRLWVRLQLFNKNPQCVQIAKGELAAICRAAGVLAPRDTEELHNRPMIIAVKSRKRKDNGESENYIVGYEKITNEPGDDQLPF